MRGNTGASALNKWDGKAKRTVILTEWPVISPMSSDVLCFCVQLLFSSLQVSFSLAKLFEPRVFRCAGEA
jgi:hypothetical protein